MRVERLSRGTWIIMAIAVGALIAWLHTTLGQATVTQTHAQSEFVNLIMRRPVSGGDGKQYPWIRSVMVYPAVETVAPYAKSSTRRAPVTYQLLSPAPGKGGWQYQAKSSLVDDPIDHYGQGPQPLTTFLSGLAADRPWVAYRYAFWNEPRWTYTIWIGGCVLLVGVIWPIVLRRLVAAGYAGRADEPEEKGPSLWKRLFTRSAKSAGSDGSGGAKVSPTSLSDDELGRIAAMEESLRDFAQTSREGGGEVEDKVEPEVKKLSADPLTASEAPKQEEPKEYGGEFYPTATHVKKKEQ